MTYYLNHFSPAQVFFFFNFTIDGYDSVDFSACEVCCYSVMVPCSDFPVKMFMFCLFVIICVRIQIMHENRLKTF